MKKTLSALLATTFLAASLPAFAANGVIDVYVNNDPVVFDTNPEIVNDRTFVPLRAIAEALGSEVEWDGETQSITLTRYDVSNYLQIGSTAVRTYGDKVEDVSTLEAAPYIKDDRTMVPIRFISEGFGMQVEWDGETQSVYITYEVIPEEPKPEFYEGFETVPNFGTYFDTEHITSSHDTSYDEYFYAEITEEQQKEYNELLLSLGFEQTYEAKNAEACSYVFEKDNVQVTSMVYSEYYDKIILTRKPSVDTSNLKYYDGFSYVPDFGKYFNIEADEASPEGQYYYLGVSAEQQAQYIALLHALGFVRIDELITDLVVSYGFQRGDEQIVVATPGESIGDNGKFAVMPLKARAEYKGELKFYEEHPAVPDYGAINAIEPVSVEKAASNITEFTYALNENAVERGNDLMSYITALTENGFESSGTYANIATFYNEKSANSIFLIQYDTSVTVIVEDVPEEFRPEENK